ncbi:hypothetical protein C8J57DRAFT_1510835 [Mycena rebaudengoi]|nr:hypothetical protein C8J57DRAFT_1510835 [Mycena rebaudengoi]
MMSTRALGLGSPLRKSLSSPALARSTLIRSTFAKRRCKRNRPRVRVGRDPEQAALLRPLSPIYQPQLTWIASIANRATGGALSTRALVSSSSAKEAPRVFFYGGAHAGCRDSSLLLYLVDFVFCFSPFFPRPHPSASPPSAPPVFLPFPPPLCPRPHPPPSSTLRPSSLHPIGRLAFPLFLCPHTTRHKPAPIPIHSLCPHPAPPICRCVPPLPIYPSPILCPSLPLPPVLCPTHPRIYTLFALSFIPTHLPHLTFLPSRTPHVTRLTPSLAIHFASHAPHPSSLPHTFPPSLRPCLLPSSSPFPFSTPHARSPPAVLHPHPRVMCPRRPIFPPSHPLSIAFFLDSPLPPPFRYPVTIRLASSAPFASPFPIRPSTPNLPALPFPRSPPRRPRRRLRVGARDIPLSSPQLSTPSRPFPSRPSVHRFGGFSCAARVRLIRSSLSTIHHSLFLLPPSLRFLWASRISVVSTCPRAVRRLERRRAVRVGATCISVGARRREDVVDRARRQLLFVREACQPHTALRDFQRKRQPRTCAWIALARVYSFFPSFTIGIILLRLFTALLPPFPLPSLISFRYFPYRIADLFCFLFTVMSLKGVYQTGYAVLADGGGDGVLVVM